MEELLYFRGAIKTSTSPENLHQCLTPNCDYIYDPAVGDNVTQTPPGTRFEDLPPDWRCPFCGAGKQGFRRLREPKIQASSASYHLVTAQ